MFDVIDFLAEPTQHVPSRRTRLIRRYGLYSSQIKGRWFELEHASKCAPAEWRENFSAESDSESPGLTPPSDTEEVEPSARLGTVDREDIRDRSPRFS